MPNSVKMATLRPIIAWMILALVPGVPVHGDTAYTQTENVLYGETGGVGLLMDVFMPEPSAQPARGLGVICVVSGAWKSDRGMVEAHRKFGLFDILCGHGYTVFAIRPGSIALFTAEQMLDNLHLGIRYVKAHAATYGIAPD
jgi:hypothetical protein